MKFPAFYPVALPFMPPNLFAAWPWLQQRTRNRKEEIIMCDSKAPTNKKIDTLIEAINRLTTALEKQQGNLAASLQTIR